jgi:hypothetical protein
MARRRHLARRFTTSVAIRSCLLLATLGLARPAFAQQQASQATAAPAERTANDTVYLELLGPGLLGSLDYERLFDESAVRIGLGAIAVPEDPGSSLHVSMPITLSYLGMRSAQHSFEIGAGAAIIASSCNAPNPCGVFWPEPVTVAPVILAGYRYQPSDGAFAFRAGFSPTFLFNDKPHSPTVLPLPYLSLGYAFQ